MSSIFLSAQDAGMDAYVEQPNQPYISLVVSVGEAVEINKSDGFQSVSAAITSNGINLM